MEVNKTSEKYQFYKDGASYILDFGEVKRAEDKSAIVEITEVDEASLVNLQSTCGCSTTDKTVVDKNTVRFNINYNDCATEFNKVLVLQYNGQQLTTILIKGRCSQ